jgi:hypothetical protein
VDYREALDILRRLKVTYDKLHQRGFESPEESRALNAEVQMLYGRIEPLALQLLGDENVEVEESHGHKAKFKNYIEAILFSSRTFYDTVGHGELTKLIGRVEQLANDPSVPTSPQSVSILLQTLRRFRACCQYVKKLPESERDIQDILWIMLRCQFEKVEREGTLAPFGLKSYRPDFGIPELRLLVEAKFVGESTVAGKLQDEILADVRPYLDSTSEYTGIAVLVYDAAHKIRDERPFVDALRSVEGIVDVVVVPGV